MEWWKEGVIYQIYPRSFNDANGDGIGDLRGIRSKLDYLKDLGIAAIWLSPINTSPMFDFGYDIENYEEIDPVFGSLDEFDLLVKEAHDRGIRVLLDMVVNHSSHLHPWFRESRSSRTNPKRDWYIWRDKPRRGRYPNNWRASFGGRAWEWDETTQQYYLHTFLKEQPDLNWRNPELRKAVYDVMRFWLKRGVDGFRFDVINWFLKDADYRSNPFGLGPTPRPYDLQKHIYDRNHPDIHPIIREIRSVLDEFEETTSVGEVFSEPPGEPALSGSYMGDGDELHMAFDFSLIFTKWNARHFYRRIQSWMDAVPDNGWPCWVMSNHDQKRTVTRLGRGLTGQMRARTAAVLLMTLRGTPFLYYGEELGLSDSRITKNQIVDPLGKRYWPFHKGRDSQRTPMPWTSRPGHGFSETTPWVPFSPESSWANVENQSRQNGSLLNLFKQLISLRTSMEALREGSWTPLHSGEGQILSFFREGANQKALIILNFGSRSRTVDLPPGAWKLMLSSAKDPGGSVLSGPIALTGHEAVILEWMKPRAAGPA